MSLHRLLFKYRYLALFTAIAVVYVLNMGIDIMEVDAAQYALISMEMSWTKSFLQVYQQGVDYLDKPPLLFWLSSLSFLTFGISNIAYKLPSVLIAILGIYSLYRFSRMYYPQKTAVLAALILGGSQALFLITNDVRTDTNLLGLTICAIWQLSQYIRSLKWQHLFWSALCIGGGMMAKGPIALVIPMAALGTDLLLKRQWKTIFKPEWIILLLMVGIVLLPMCYGLYTQFDMHPEKTVYGLQGPSGLRFFFWTQSFGRITGESTWADDSTFFYFMHTILWDFQPWIFLFIPALVMRCKRLVLQKFKAQPSEEYISLGGFVLMFIAFSLSRYKLPHYIFVLFPFASIITADFICRLNSIWLTRIARIQFAILHVFGVLMIVCITLFFPAEHVLIYVFLIIAVFGINFYCFRLSKGKPESIFIPALIVIIAFNFFMATYFYPHVLQYQSGSQAGKFVIANKIDTNRVFHYKAPSLAFDFYTRKIITGIELNTLGKSNKNVYVYTNEEGYKDIGKAAKRVQCIAMFPSFHVTQLTLDFLLKDQREKHVEKYYLLRIH